MTGTTRPVRVWDLPTRLFHWSLAALVVFAILSAETGGEWMVWHFRAGFAVLTLLAFRIIWGFIGGRYARFSSWRLNRAALAQDLRTDAPETPGHSATGSLAVAAMLATISVQVGSGLCAHDEMDFGGPLARHLSNATSDALTALHHLNGKLILALVVLHLAAVAFYFVIKKRNLVRPMLTGDKHGIDPSTASRDDAALRLLAAVLLAALGGAAVWLLG